MTESTDARSATSIEAANFSTNRNMSFGCRSIIFTSLFGCLPGLILGLGVGVVTGVWAWISWAPAGPTNPLIEIGLPLEKRSLASIEILVKGLVREPIADSRHVGLAIVVVRGDESAVWCFGQRRLDQPTPPDGDTIFELASVGKTFTGLLLAEMAASGEIGFDDELSAHLPGDVQVPSFNKKEIRLIDLATQTSGLPSLPANFEFKDALNPYKDFTTEQMFAGLTQIELSRKPGSAYEYSNLAYGLLGEALARKANAPYEQAVIDRICAPLRMTRTCMTLNDALRDNLATPHDGGQAVKIWEDTTMPGAGSFLSSANDMLKYMRLYQGLNETKLGKLSLAATEATIKRRPADVGWRSMGLAWHIDSENAHDICWHNGAAGGSTSYVAFAQRPFCGVVVLSNSSTSVDELGRLILYLLMQTDE